LSTKRTHRLAVAALGLSLGLAGTVPATASDSNEFSGAGLLDSVTGGGSGGGLLGSLPLLSTGGGLLGGLPLLGGGSLPLLGGGDLPLVGDLPVVGDAVDNVSGGSLFSGLSEGDVMGVTDDVADAVTEGTVVEEVTGVVDDVPAGGLLSGVTGGDVLNGVTGGGLLGGVGGGLLSGGLGSLLNLDMVTGLLGGRV